MQWSSYGLFAAGIPVGRSAGRLAVV